MNIKTVEVCENDASFLCRLRNDEKILDTLNEVPTQVSDWTEAISAWSCDNDEEDYIMGSYVISQLTEKLKARGFIAVILFTNQNNLRAQK